MEVTTETIEQEIAKESERAIGLATAHQQSLGRIDAYKRVLAHLRAPEEKVEEKCVDAPMVDGSSHTIYSSEYTETNESA